MRLNLFYPAVVVVGLVLFFLFSTAPEAPVSFYGFAESNETAINYNYPIVVDEILVQPGASVRAGQPLLRVSRRRAKETLADQPYQIRELNAEEQLWRQRKRDELALLRAAAATRRQRYDEQLAELEDRLAYQQSLTTGLENITTDTATYRPLRDRIAALRRERARDDERGRAEAAARERELRLGSSPYRARISRLNAEARFDSSQLVQPFTVTAPADGLIGTLRVKEREHVPAYATLLSFYEPHSSLVSGYLHEDQTAGVALGDRFTVYSLKDPTISYPGTVTGLGSRIVSIPPRLRELREFETYGREVTVEIPLDNRFLQKEKVGLRKLPAP